VGEPEKYFQSSALLCIIEMHTKAWGCRVD
jgi:hypothetical protein